MSEAATEQDIPFEEPAPDEPQTEEPDSGETEDTDPEQTEEGEADDEDTEAPPAEESAGVATGPGLTEAQAEKIMRDATNDWQRFRDRTVKRWEGEGEYLRDCPLCFDQHKGLVDLRHAGHYPQEITDAVMGFLGLARERAYKQSGKHQTCSFCDGEGKVQTGSHVPGKTTVDCPECKGYGYTPPPGLAVAASTSHNGEVIDEHNPVDDLEHGEYDEFDEPRILPDGRENPNFGRRPAYKVTVEPWGVTAGLRA